MRAKFVHESLVGGVLKPKTRDQIINDLSKLSQEDKNIKLIGASWYGYKDVVELLLKGGADVNAIDKYGWTPLMWASRNGHKDIVELLKKYGAKENQNQNQNENLNESDNRLKIYKNSDDSYSVIRNSFLYTFLWKPYTVYNFKKVGKINSDYTISGKLLNKPHIQMILQLQRKININESKIFKPKTKDEIDKEIENINDPFTKWLYKTFQLLLNMDVYKVLPLEVNKKDELIYLFYCKDLFMSYYNDGYSSEEAAKFFMEETEEIEDEIKDENEDNRVHIF